MKKYKPERTFALFHHPSQMGKLMKKPAGQLRNSQRDLSKNSRKHKVHNLLISARVAPAHLQKLNS
jgi:hypothetical protein